MSELKVVKIRKRQASQEIKLLHKLLGKDIETGKINGLFVVATDISGNVCSGYSMDRDSAVFTMLGGVEVLKKRYVETEIE